MKQTASANASINQDDVLQAVKRGRVAAVTLASASADQRKQAIEFAAEELKSHVAEILQANKQDMNAAAELIQQGKIAQSLVERLKVDADKVQGMIDGLLTVAALPDPLNSTTLSRELDDGLELYKVTCPIGLVAIIFESRPDALPQISGLSVKSGNALILKGGKEARETNRVLFDCIQRGLVRAGLPQESITLLESREAIDTLLKADKYVDLIIPRGSNQLVRHIQENTRIPVLGHADGLCHLYVDVAADIDTAIKLIVDAKTQYPAACNSIETILIHETIADKIMPLLVPKLLAKSVELRGDQGALEATPVPMRQSIKPACEDDWNTEYSDLIVSIKLVSSIDDAISHINEYGSHHTECIVTQDKATFEKFFAAVDAAGVFWNASTRFADGFRYGFGAEVGISTGKLHPRGPVGVEGLLTYKYKLMGKGHIVSDYVGETGKKFSHKAIKDNQDNS